MCLLFETILLEEGKPVNLDLHESRMNAARAHFWNSEPLNLMDYIPPEPGSEGSYRLRISYDQSINKISVLPLERREVRSLQTVVSDEIEYSFKFTDRKALDALFNKRNNSDDVLIIKQGIVTDTSSANIVFAEGTNLFTPLQPLLKGTQREFLIRSGVLKETVVKKEDIPNFTSWQHINALNPFNPGRFQSINKINL